MLSEKRNPACGATPEARLEALLQSVAVRASVIERVLSSAGQQSLLEYLTSICCISPVSFQSRDDLAGVVEQYLMPLLGDSLAKQAALDLLQHPVALTANHHGVDFFAQSVQGSFLFGIAKQQVPGICTIPVFSCANIPLDNLTYPRGALLYASDPQQNWPQRIPFFSNKLRRQPVARVKGLDRPMLQQAAKQVRRLIEIGQNTASLECLLDVLETEYMAEDVLSKPGYSAQSVILNQRIWSRLFCPSAMMPELITIELETLAEGLFLKDLSNSESLVSVLFAMPMISELYRQLDGVGGCWNDQQLQQRWADRRGAEPLKTSGCGTFFFWGVDQRQRRIPLMLASVAGVLMLQGCDDNGNESQFHINSKALIQAIEEGRLLPSVFGCFLVIALARGVTCLGGYYQAEYLPQMQAGVIAVLRQYDRLDIAAILAECCTDGYLSGMQAVMVEQAGALLPAGVLEILASGAITATEVAFIRTISLRDAHYASLAETTADLMPQKMDSQSRVSLMIDQHKYLLDKVILRQ
ncbi:hypothetical protein [Amphritea sp.]|uniref:hypothetical protein n=1 Tax=Amphritea sp. TaxID=1872502 RepID=UPI003A8DF0A0